MTYSKPEVRKLASSLEAIHSDGKEVPSFLDNYPTNQLIATAGAYQADE